MKTMMNTIYAAFAAAMLTCLALAPAVQAVTPAPDGGYSNWNTAEGENALFSLTTGAYDTALGGQALYHNTDGSGNTASGYGVLYSNTTGPGNTATGYEALYHNTTGTNTATGYRALFGNTTGSGNSATGFQALLGNTIGTGNVANGSQALQANTTGNVNTAVGNLALKNNTTGYSNTAIGNSALFSNTTGYANEALGWHALYSNTSGYENKGVGDATLSFNTTGSFNVAVGNGALLRNTTGSANIALGHNAGDNLTIGSNNIDIGHVGFAYETNTIRLGTPGVQGFTFIAGISGAAVTGAPVVVSSSGRLGVATSSKRFKDAIKPMDKASEAILALKPVTFRYKSEIDPDGTPQFGLVAEEVEKVNPDLVARDADGKPYTVRYEAVNAMLLNEFLKEHSTVQEMKSTLAKQEAIMTEHRKDFESKLAQQQQQIKALTAGLQRVSAQLEVTKPAPQTVLNNQ